MVALKDKRKWTRAEYKGEHERSSRDMNYNSFHDASTDLQYHSAPRTLSLSVVASGGFFSAGSQTAILHREYIKAAKNSLFLKYSMSIHLS